MEIPGAGSLTRGITPRSIKSHDLDGGLRGLVQDLVLQLHPGEASLASRGIFRGRHSAGLHCSTNDGVVGAIVPAKDDLDQLDVGTLDGEADLFDVFLPATATCLDLGTG